MHPVLTNHHEVSISRDMPPSDHWIALRAIAVVSISCSSCERSQEYLARPSSAQSEPSCLKARCSHIGCRECNDKAPQSNLIAKSRLRPRDSFCNVPNLLLSLVTISQSASVGFDLLEVPLNVAYSATRDCQHQHAESGGRLYGCP